VYKFMDSFQLICFCQFKIFRVGNNRSVFGDSPIQTNTRARGIYE